MIILNEKEYIEDIIADKNPVTNMYYTLTLLARYYNQLGYKPSIIYRELEGFLKKQNEDIVDWQISLDKIIKKRKKDLLEIDFAPITKKELEIIKGIKNKRLEKLAFTLLCMAKLNNIIQPKNNNWVNREFKEIFKLANIRDNVNKQCLSINDLNGLGLIKYSHKIDNLNLCVTYVSDDEVELKIDDYRDLGFQYLAYLGEGFIKCECCGRPVKKTGNKIKYCNDCAKKINIEKTIKNRKSLK